MECKDNLDETISNFFEFIIFLHRNLFNPESMMKRYSMPISQIKVLFFLYKKGNSIVSDIADSLSINRSNLTPILENLYRNGYIEKATLPKDKRYYIISITEKGKQFVDEKESLIKMELKEKFKSISDEELDLLNKYMIGTKEILSDICKKQSP
ncbi:MAG: MarR family transcriptional regulator [Andreesenia angusta]|nr:MarR family transcriptional regulator [Andreesenia angusta]